MDRRVGLWEVGEARHRELSSQAEEGTVGTHGSIGVKAHKEFQLQHRGMSGSVWHTLLPPKPCFLSPPLNHISGEPLAVGKLQTDLKQ